MNIEELSILISAFLIAVCAWCVWLAFRDDDDDFDPFDDDYKGV